MKWKQILAFIIGVIVTIFVMQVVGNRISNKRKLDRKIIVKDLLETRDYIFENIIVTDRPLYDLTTNNEIGRFSVVNNGETTYEFLFSMITEPISGKDAIEFDYSFEQTQYDNILLRPIDTNLSFFLSSDLLDNELRIVVNEMKDMKKVYNLNLDNRHFLVTILRDSDYRYYTRNSSISNTNGLSLYDLEFAAYFSLE